MVDYFREALLEGRHKNSMKLFKLAALVHPHSLNEISAKDGREEIDARIEHIRRVKRFDKDDLIEKLKLEMHGRAATETEPQVPSLLTEAKRWANVRRRFSIGEKCLVRRLVKVPSGNARVNDNNDLVNLQRRVGTPEPAKVTGYDRTLGEQRLKYRIRFDKDLVEELVEPKFVERTHVDVLYYLWCRRDKFPEWYEVSIVLALLHPTSAGAERVFSLLQAFFADNGRRAHALSDLINTTLKLRYHDRPT